MKTSELQELIRRYISLFPADRSKLKLLLTQLKQPVILNDRQTLPGHITAAGIVLSPDHKKVLMIHHRFLNLWLQPGGHWDKTDRSPLEAAKREIKEETGVSVAEYIPISPENPDVPLYIGEHRVPENPEKHEATHYHHDFRYCFIAGSEKVHPKLQEVTEARWFPLSSPETEHIAEDLERIKRYGQYYGRAL